MISPDTPQKFPVVPLGAMGFAAFIYVNFEMFAVGLISPMVADLGVSEGRIGLLMSIYAGLVAVVTIPLMHATRNVDRRPLFIATLFFLMGGVVLQALAPSYLVLTAGRITAAFTHGLFWSLVNPMAARLAPAGQTGRAVAAVSLGSTMSTVVGAPLTTALGGWIGWRGATWVLGAGVVAAVVLLHYSLPGMPAKRPAADASSAGTRSAIPSLMVYLALAVTAIFCTFTYLALLIGRTAGAGAVPVGLGMYGVFGLVGVTWAGRRVDMRMIRLNAAAAGLLGLAALVGVAALELGSGALMFLAVAVLGTAAGALPTVATTIFLHAGQRNQDLASSIYVVTFQVGIASGSALGAATVDAGFLPGTLLATLALAAAAFLTLAVLSRPKLR